MRAGRRPERTIYEITDAGLREMADWLSELLAAPVKEYLQFEAAPSLLPALPPPSSSAARASRSRSPLSTEQCRRPSPTACPALFALESEYTQVLRRAELDYVQRLAKDIESGDLSGIDQWRSWYARAYTLGDDAERVLGHSASYFATRSLLWCALFIAVFAPLAARRYKRG